MFKLERTETEDPITRASWHVEPKKSMTVAELDQVTERLNEALVEVEARITAARLKVQ